MYYLLCSLSKLVVSIVSAVTYKPFTKAEFSIQWEWIQWEIQKMLPWLMSANCQSSPVWIQKITEDCRALEREKEMHRWIEKEWINFKSIEKIFSVSPWKKSCPKIPMFPARTNIYSNNTKLRVIKKPPRHSYQFYWEG